MKINKNGEKSKKMIEIRRIERNINKIKQRQKYLRNQWLDNDLKLNVLKEMKKWQIRMEEK